MLFADVQKVGGIHRLPALEELQADHNKFAVSCISDALPRLETLRHLSILNLSGNNVGGIPRCVGAIQSLVSPLLGFSSPCLLAWTAKQFC